MTAAEIAGRLVACWGETDFPALLEQLRPQLNLAVVAALKQQVDREKLRHAGRAMAVAEVAAAVAGVIATDEARALALWAKGNAAYHLAQHQQALDSYRRAQTIYTAAADALAVACMQVNQVAVLQEMGDYQPAIDLAGQARPTLEQLGAGARRFIAILEMNVGSAYQQLGQPEAALAAYERGRTIHAALDNQVGVARMDINRANALQDMDQFVPAARLLQQARSILAQNDLPQEVARAELSLGRLAYRRGQYQAALRYLEAAHDGFAAIPNPTDVAVVNLHRSTIYRDLNLLQETVTLAEQAEKRFRRVGMHNYRAAAMINRGVGNLRLGLYAEAGKLLAQARRLLWQQGATMRVLMLDLERADLALAQGQVDTARRIARRVGNRLDARTWPALVARLRLLLARCALADEPANAAQAQQEIRRALALTSAHNLPELMAEAQHLTGRLLAAGGDLQAAWDAYRRAVETLEGLRAWLGLDEFQTGFMANKLALYDDVVRLSRRLAAPALLAYALDLACNAPLSALTTAAGLPETTDRTLQERLQTFREAWHWHQSKLEQPDSLRLAGSEADAQILHHRLRELETEIAELTRRARVRAAAALERPQPVLDVGRAETFLAGLQDRLAPNQALLHYYILDDHFQVLLITCDGVHPLPALGPTGPLIRVLRAWKFHLSHSHARLNNRTALAQAQAQLQRFHQVLIAPLGNHLAQGIDQLFVVLPPDWHELPLAAFYDGQTYLAQRFRLTYLSAPRRLPTAPPTHPLAEAAAEAMVVGYSDGGRLPHNLAEARRVAETLQSSYQPVLLLEREATVRRVRAAAQTSRLLHLASHAVFRPDNPRFSWVRLADQRLTVADLAEMRLPQRPLVVLSACETGRGQARGGGLLGMGRGFLAAGASGLVVSLWQIEDRASARLMADFYRHLSSAGQPAAALSQAQQTALAGGQHPFFWAGFVYIQG